VYLKKNFGGYAPEPPGQGRGEEGEGMEGKGDKGKEEKGGRERRGRGYGWEGKGLGPPQCLTQVDAPV
jgi:hypothetical protein